MLASTPRRWPSVLRIECTYQGGGERGADMIGDFEDYLVGKESRHRATCVWKSTRHVRSHIKQYDREFRVSSHVATAELTANEILNKCCDEFGPTRTLLCMLSSPCMSQSRTPSPRTFRHPIVTVIVSARCVKRPLISWRRTFSAGHARRLSLEREAGTF